MIKQTHILFIFLLVFLFGCKEDPIEPILMGSLVGEVVLEADNSPVDKVTISTTPSTSSVFTDVDGRFTLDQLASGTYTIRAEKTGFSTKIETISIFANQATNVILKLLPDTLNNSAPNIPFDPVPTDGETDLTNEVTLEWSSNDIDSDELMYTVRLYNSEQTEDIEVATGITDSMVVLEGLLYNTTYFWQVIVDDGFSAPVNGPVWSFRTGSLPDYRILFSKFENGKYDIYAGNEDGEYVRLTTNLNNNWRPRMNPARDKIAYISNIGIESHIFIMDRDGSNAEQITTLPISGYNNFELDFCWSPDGAKLMYMNNNRLYTINIDGTALSLFAEAPAGHTFTECDWSTQGRVVARTTGINSFNSLIFAYEEDGTFELQALGDIPGATGGPAISIDGNAILLTNDISEFESNDGRQLDAHIFLRNLELVNTVDLSIEKDVGTNDLDPRFSPNGAQVIFTNTSNDGVSPKNILIMDFDGDHREVLFENAEMPDWR